MRNNYRIALCFIFSLLFLLFSACGKGKNESLKPDSSSWADALPAEDMTGFSTLSEDELKEKAKTFLGPDSNWDGDFSKLTDEEKMLIQRAFKKEGYEIQIGSEGIKILRDPLPALSDVYDTSPYTQGPVLSGASLILTKAFGGCGNAMFDRVAATRDGGFIASAFFASASGDCAGANKNWEGQKVALVKYSKVGDIEWNSFLGGDGGGIKIRAITQLEDNGFILAGETASPSLGAADDRIFDAVLIKFSASGKQEWLKIVGGAKNEYFSGLASTPDGGFVAGGKTDSSDGFFEGLQENMISAFLLKFDKDGKLLWKRVLSGSKHSAFEGLAVNEAGIIFATCRTMSNDGDFKGFAGRGGADTLVLSYEKDGVFRWARSFSGSGDDELTAITTSPDGGCVIAGKYKIYQKTDGSFEPYHNAGSYDAFVVKYNKDGAINWAKPLAGFKDEEITGITRIKGGYAAVGISSSANRDFVEIGNKGGRDGFLFLLNENGEKMHLSSLSGTGEDVPRAVSSYDGESFVVTGGTNSSDLFFAGLNPPVTKKIYNCFFALYEVQTN